MKTTDSFLAVGAGAAIGLLISVMLGCQAVAESQHTEDNTCNCGTELIGTFALNSGNDAEAAFLHGARFEVSFPPSTLASGQHHATLEYEDENGETVRVLFTPREEHDPDSLSLPSEGGAGGQNN